MTTETVTALDALAALRQEQAVRELPERTTEGFVRTPPVIAEMIVSGHAGFMELGAGARVLEPSAGDGSLLLEILETSETVHVTAVEPNPVRADVLDRIAAATGRVTVYRGTLEQFAATVLVPFDAVIMNPPFAVTGDKAPWIRHVQLAHALTIAGGRVSAIVPASYPSRGDKAHRAFREWAQNNGGFWEVLPEDAFGGFRTGVLTVPVPLPAREDSRPSWVFGPRVEAVPLRMARPDTSPRAAQRWPVQVYRDELGNENRVIRFAGTCAHCARLIWAHDNGHQEAQLWSSCAVLDAAAEGLDGPDIGLCMEHRSHGDVSGKVRALAGEYWTVPATPAPSVSPAVYPMDLCKGMSAVVTGEDWRGWTFTMARELCADPALADIDGVQKVNVRFHRGGSEYIDLFVDPGQRVTVLDGPATVTTPPVPPTAPPVQAAPVRDLWGPYISAMQATARP